MKVGIFTVTSALHDVEIIEKSSSSFINTIINHTDLDIVEAGEGSNNFGGYDLNVIFIRTGGTENRFKELFANFPGPFYLLSSGTSNSLAASMEISSWLRSKGKTCEILHGDTKYICSRLTALARVNRAAFSLRGRRYGIIGNPSDWLISSGYDGDKLQERLGIELVDIPMEELLKEIGYQKYPEKVCNTIKQDYDGKTFQGALHVYGALSRLVEKYELSGFTVRCFDLLDTVANTGCLALSIFNRDGIIGSCEGDVPAMISMAVLNALTGKPVFQANPSSLNVSTNEMIFAHCTIPLNMVKDYKYESHFESGLGVAIKGVVPRGEATVFKTSGDVGRYYVSDATIISNLSSPNLCRTQIRIKPEKSVKGFLTSSIGNHHIICNGSYSDLVDEFFRFVN